MFLNCFGLQHLGSSLHFLISFAFHSAKTYVRQLELILFSFIGLDRYRTYVGVGVDFSLSKVAPPRFGTVESSLILFLACF